MRRSLFLLTLFPFFSFADTIKTICPKNTHEWDEWRKSTIGTLLDAKTWPNKLKFLVDCPNAPACIAPLEKHMRARLQVNKGETISSAEFETFNGKDIFQIPKSVERVILAQNEKEPYLTAALAVMKREVPNAMAVWRNGTMMILLPGEKVDVWISSGLNVISFAVKKTDEKGKPLDRPAIYFRAFDRPNSSNRYAEAKNRPPTSVSMWAELTRAFVSPVIPREEFRCSPRPTPKENLNPFLPTKTLKAFELP